MLKTPAHNTLFYGDNLAILREHVEDESVDLVYLDPPFNSNANYNLLFKAPDGHQSQAQIEAFDDTWHWNEPAEQAFERGDAIGQFGRGGNAARDAVVFERERHDGLSHHDGGALDRIASGAETGGLALSALRSDREPLFEDSSWTRCSAPTQFRTEISWRRQSAHSDAKQGRVQYGNVRDVILLYTKRRTWTWNWLYTAYNDELSDGLL